VLVCFIGQSKQAAGGGDKAKPPVSSKSGGFAVCSVISCSDRNGADQCAEDEVHDSTRPDRDGPENSRSRPFRADNRLVMAVAFVTMCLGILSGGHLYGRYLGSFNSPGLDDTITELRIRTQVERRQADTQAAELTAVEAKLKSTQAALDSIMPSPNTYTIKPNQTLIVGDGHLTVGMVGAPGNDAITVNVNGKQQPLAAGQTINVAPDDPATQCQLSVQSFNMFKATLVATCLGAKAK
jgi:hypothetical protein